MIRFGLYLLVLVFLTACSQKSVLQNTTTVPSHKKSFEQEDVLILFALRAEQITDYQSAAMIFNTLYEKSNKREYFQRSLQNYLTANDFQTVIEKVNKDIKQGHQENYFARRFKILALIGLEKYDEAKAEGVLLVQNTQNVDDYLLVSDIYIQLQEYDTALKYLEGAYTKDYNEKLLDKMSIILYVNLQRKTDAIAQLETHSRVHGCSKLICTRLISIYSNENNIDGLLSTYLRLYQVQKSEDISKKIVQIFAYKKDYIGMMNFLEKSQSDDKTLLELYASTKNYEKAYKLAQKLYDDTGDVNYLGQSAIYEYEGNLNKDDELMLQGVVQKLKDVVRNSSSSLYSNYLGYILIDHEINIDLGINYVNDALDMEPNSAYYLDSLAWGYFKLGNCKEAKKIMNKVVQLEGADNEEVISHIKSIDKCIQN